VVSEGNLVSGRSEVCIARVPILVISLQACLCAEGVAAEIHKSRMPDGSIVYARFPEPGAARSERLFLLLTAGVGLAKVASDAETRRTFVSVIEPEAEPLVSEPPPPPRRSFRRR
jgi:hypothetical protein